MNQADQDRLLREVLETDELRQLRDTSMQHMVAAASQRRQRRRARSALASLAVFVAAGFVVHSQVRTNENSRPANPPAVVGPTVATITDDQLLELFANRSVALVGTAGEQTLVFLDAPATGTRAHR